MQRFLAALALSVAAVAGPAAPSFVCHGAQETGLQCACTSQGGPIMVAPPSAPAPSDCTSASSASPA